jgi:hypothetical protein
VIDVGFILIVSLIVIYADGQLTKRNFGSQFNGIGSIVPVLTGRSLMPMQHRVLVAWLCWFVSKPFGWGDDKFPFFKIYLWIRWIAILTAMTMSHLYFGHFVMTAMLALFFVWAALYDYTDGYIEVACFASAFYLIGVGGLWMYVGIAIVSFLGALNRETSVFIPVVIALTGQWWLTIVSSGFFLCGFALPRLMYRGVPRYCSLWMLPVNLRALKQEFLSKPAVYSEYLFFLVLAALMVVTYAVSFPWGPIEIGLGVMFLALLVPTMWREIRVFSPVMLGLIPMVVRYGSI